MPTWLNVLCLTLIILLVLVDLSYCEIPFRDESGISTSADIFVRATSVVDGPERCSHSKGCADGSCCSVNGTCGYGPSYCGTGCMWDCDSEAMCGKYSSGGAVACGMNLCCSEFGWCGTDTVHCTPGPTSSTGCQKGFGSCSIATPKTCGVGSGTTNGRTIAYYQGSNVYQRHCDTVSPRQINTTGITHLYWAFADFDPIFFSIRASDPRDIDLYKEFTGLKKPDLETWIAIGGWEFSDPGPTHHAWSDMVGSKGNRALFIKNLIRFMDTYGFQGADLDWEYPGSPGRGGKVADKENFVSLVKEMRTAFGTKYGISVTIAPDIGSVNGFDATAMADSVNWFGFMAYDLYGPWDIDDAVGNNVHGQTDWRSIKNDTTPLWFAHLDPSKINFGVAYYGRGYTLESGDCTTIGCKFSGPSDQGDCTRSPGVLSLKEIDTVMTNKNVKSTYLDGPMMKQIVFPGSNGTQWIGYDDSETIAKKKAQADNYCFGGTMIWSIDFQDNPNSGDDVDNNTGWMINIWSMDEL